MSAREKGHFIETPRLRVHYRRSGQGSNTLIFVHGNYASSRWWIPQLERLPQGFQAFAPDLRGCGGLDGNTQLLQSDRNERLSIRDLADDLHEFVSALGITAPILVGHSFGCLVVIEYALRHQEDVRGLVLEDSGPPDGIPLTDMTEPLFMPLEFGNRQLMQVALQMVGLSPRNPLSRALVDDALAAAHGQYQALTRAAGNWSVEASLPSLHVPTLLIWGKHDRIMPSRIGKRYLRLLPDAQMTVIPGAGHSPHLERPDEFAARLQDFIAQLTPDAENASKAATQWEQLKSAVVRWLDIR